MQLATSAAFSRAPVALRTLALLCGHRRPPQSSLLLQPGAPPAPEPHAWPVPRAVCPALLLLFLPAFFSGVNNTKSRQTEKRMCETPSEEMSTLSFTWASEAPLTKSYLPESFLFWLYLIFLGGGGGGNQVYLLIDFNGGAGD